MCRQCLQQWNDSHIRLYNLATTPDCPECRQPGRHYVKVCKQKLFVNANDAEHIADLISLLLLQVFMLEEVVRTVDRLERLGEYSSVESI